MDKLTPQNAEQECMIQILLAKMQGFEVEHFDCGGWHHSPSNYFDFKSIYRIKSHELPITKEMWGMIDKKWKWVAKDNDGDVWFYTERPHRKDYCWSADLGRCALNALTLNTDGIDWKKSLTERPEGV